MSVDVKPSAAPVARAARVAGLWRSLVGRKAIMAATGAVLSVWVLAHMLGNLQAFESAAQLDRYSRLLRIEPGILWAVRVVAGVCLVMHVVAGVSLWVRKRSARPVGYAEYRAVAATPSSRTMIWSGLLVLAYVPFHLLDLTFGAANPDFQPGQVFHNTVASLVRGGVAAVYVVAAAALGWHLWHGLWSMTQSAGTANLAYMPTVKRFAVAMAWILFAGFAAVPVAIALHLVGS